MSAGWLAAGVFAAAMPLAIHLWSRRRAARVCFPPARLILAAAAGQTRRRRLRDALLLALRVLAVMILAAGFARPLWQRSGVDAPMSERGTALVILLDASASMRRAERGTALFESARREALSALAGLDPQRDVAAVVMLGAEPRLLLPVLSANIPALIGMVRDTECTLGRGEAAEGLRQAESLLLSDESRHRDRTILILSDMQATTWARALEVDPTVKVDVNRVGAGVSPGNLAVTDVGVSPARPIAGEPAMLLAIARNYSDETRAITVRFSIAGQAAGEAVADVEAWGERQVGVPVRFDSTGPLGIEAAINADSFEWDDVSRAGITVADRSRAAMVTASAEAGDPGSAAWFMRAALEASLGAAPEVLPVGSIGTVPLDGLDALVVIGAGGLSEFRIRELIAFAERGGVLLWVIDSREAAESVRRSASASAAAPVMIERWIGDESKPMPARPALAAAGGDGELSGVLRAWSGAGVAAAAEAGVRPGAGGLLESDAGPLAARASIAGGSLVMLTMDLSPDRSRVVRSPLFPALIHSVLREEQSTSIGGDRGSIGRGVTARAGVSFVEPLRDSLGRSVQVSRGQPAVMLVIDPVPEPMMLTLSDVGGRTASMVGVNIDPEESDFRGLGEQEIERLARGKGDDGGVSALQRSALPAAPPVELWPLFIGGVMVLLAVEGWLRQRPRKGDAR